MKQYRISGIIILLLLIGSVVLPACVVVNEHRSGGPPPWAPAHGHRAKHTYYYYPGQYVYYDLSSRIYFYRSGGSWVSATALPPGIRIDVGKHDVLEMDSDTPYVYHQEVVKRYPPGQLKKQGKEKDRGKH